MSVRLSSYKLILRNKVAACICIISLAIVMLIMYVNIVTNSLIDFPIVIAISAIGCTLGNVYLDSISRPFSFTMVGYKYSARNAMFQIFEILSVLCFSHCLLAAGGSSFDDIKVAISFTAVVAIFYWLPIVGLYAFKNSLVVVPVFFFIMLFAAYGSTTEFSIVDYWYIVAAIAGELIWFAWKITSSEKVFRDICIAPVVIFKTNYDSVKIKERRAATSRNKDLEIKQNVRLGRFGLFVQSKLKSSKHYSIKKYIWGGIASDEVMNRHILTLDLKHIALIMPAIMLLAILGMHSSIVFMFIVMTNCGKIGAKVHSSDIYHGGREERFYSILSLSIVWFVIVMVCSVLIYLFSAWYSYSVIPKISNEWLLENYKPFHGGMLYGHALLIIFGFNIGVYGKKWKNMSYYGIFFILMMTLIGVFIANYRELFLIWGGYFSLSVLVIVWLVYIYELKRACNSYDFITCKSWG